MRVLLTGMSGTGKSALVHELRRRGYPAHDADDGFAEPRADGRWGWRADLVADLLAQAPDQLESSPAAPRSRPSCRSTSGCC